MVGEDPEHFQLFIFPNYLEFVFFPSVSKNLAILKSRSKSWTVIIRSRQIHYFPSSFLRTKRSQKTSQVHTPANLSPLTSSCFPISANQNQNPPPAFVRTTVSQNRWFQFLPFVWVIEKGTVSFANPNPRTTATIIPTDLQSSIYSFELKTLTMDTVLDLIHRRVQ